MIVDIGTPPSVLVVIPSIRHDYIVSEHVRRAACLLPATSVLMLESVIFIVATDSTEDFAVCENAECTCSIAVASVLLGFVVVATVAFVALFRFRWRKTMNALVITSFALVWAAFCGFFLVSIASANGIDWITTTFVAVNFSGVGVYEVFFAVDETTLLGSWYLITLGAMVAYPLARLPDVTLLFFLILLCVWDVLAVCTPCGPLRYALAIQQERVWMAEDDFTLPRGMVYRASLYELGMGDMIFFGLISARATAATDYSTTVACIFAMLASVVFTVLLTVILNQTIPALPLALSFGILIFAAAKFSLQSAVLDWGSMMILT